MRKTSVVKTFKRALSVVLAVAMILSMDMPMTAQATERGNLKTYAETEEAAPEIRAKLQDTAGSNDGKEAFREPDVGRQAEEKASQEPEAGVQAEEGMPQALQAEEPAPVMVSAGEVEAIALNGKKLVKRSDGTTFWNKFTAEHAGVYTFHADPILEDNDDRYYIYMQLRNDPESSSYLASDSGEKALAILRYMQAGETIYFQFEFRYRSTETSQANLYVTEETYGTELSLGNHKFKDEDVPTSGMWLPYDVPEDGVYRFKVTTQENASEASYYYAVLDVKGEVLKEFLYEEYRGPRKGTMINYYTLSKGDRIYVRVEKCYRDMTVSLMKLEKAELLSSHLQSGDSLDLTVTDSEYLVKFQAPKTANYRFRCDSPVTLYKDMNGEAIKSGSKTTAAMVEQHVLDYRVEKDEIIYLVITESCALTVQELTITDIVIGEEVTVNKGDGQFQWFRFTAGEYGFYDVRFTVPSGSAAVYLYESLDSVEAKGRVVYSGSYQYEYTEEMEAGQVCYLYVNTLDVDGCKLVMSKRKLQTVRNAQNDYTFITNEIRLDMKLTPGYRSVNVAMNVLAPDGSEYEDGYAGLIAHVYYREKGTSDWSSRNSLEMTKSGGYAKENINYNLKTGTEYEIKVRLYIDYYGFVVGEFVSSGSAVINMTTDIPDEDYIIELEEKGGIVGAHFCILSEDSDASSVQWRAVGEQWNKSNLSLGYYGESWNYFAVKPDKDYEFRIVSGNEEEGTLVVYKTATVSTGSYPLQVTVTVDPESITETEAKAKVKVSGYEGLPGVNTRIYVESFYKNINRKDTRAQVIFNLKPGETGAEGEIEFSSLAAGETYRQPIQVSVYPSPVYGDQIWMDAGEVEFTTKASELADNIELKITPDQNDGSKINYQVRLKDTAGFDEDRQVVVEFAYIQKDSGYSRSSGYCYLAKSNNYEESGTLSGLCGGLEYEVLVKVDYKLLLSRTVTTAEDALIKKIEIEPRAFGAKLSVEMTDAATGSYQIRAFLDKGANYEMYLSGTNVDGRLTDANGHKGEWKLSTLDGSNGVLADSTHRIKVRLIDDEETIREYYFLIKTPALDLQVRTTNLLGTEERIEVRLDNPDDTLYGSAFMYLYYRQKDERDYWHYAAQMEAETYFEEEGGVVLSDLAPETEYELMLTSNMIDAWGLDGYIVYKTGEFTTGEEVLGDPHTVTFDLKGKGSNFDVTVYEGKKVDRPTKPTAAGFLFTGWYRDEDCEEAWNFATDKVYEDITLYAGWEPLPKYTVTFDFREKADNKSREVSEGEKLVALPVSDVLGFTFGGWYRDEDCEDKWNFNQDVVTEDRTLYAKWIKVDVCKVTFELLGHGEAIETISVNKGGKIEKPRDPAEQGFLFGGWYKDAECKEAWDFAGDKVEQDMTLYAKWKEDDTTYKVKFNMGNLGNAVPEQTVKKGGLVVKPDDPTAAGYVFGGWYADAAYTRVWDFAKDIVTGDTVIYAKWTQDTSTESPEDVEDTYYKDYYADKTRKDLKNDVHAEIAKVKPKVYDGSAYLPVVKVTATVDGRKVTLTEGADYRVLYEKNVNAGTGTVIVKGNGEYDGEIKEYFEITKKSMKKLKVIAGGMTFGSQTEPLIYVYDGGRLLEKGKDYTLSDTTGLASSKGTKTVTVTATDESNYKDSTTAKVAVYEAENILIPEDVTVEEPCSSYTGKAQKPEVTVTHGGEKLAKNCYSVKYTNNKDVGIAYVTVKGKKGYAGSVVKTFEITPVKSAFAVKGEKIKSVTYNGKLQKPKVTIVVQNGTKTQTLKAGKDYTISYSNNLHATKNAVVTIKGKGNYAGTADGKFTFEIDPQQLKKAVVKGKKDALTLTYSKRELKPGTDYTVISYSPENKGKVEVTLEGKNDFTGTVVKKVAAN